MPGDGEVPLDVQAVFTRRHDTGPYRRRVIYEPTRMIPPLDRPRTEWMERDLQEAARGASLMAGRFLSSRILTRVGMTRLVLASAVLSLVAALIVAFAQSQHVAVAGAILLGLGFAAIFPSTLVVVGEAFPAFTGTAFSVAFVVALSGGMTAPWLTGRIAAESSLRQGMLVPVVTCAAIVVLQLAIMRILRRNAPQR